MTAQERDRDLLEEVDKEKRRMKGRKMRGEEEGRGRALSGGRRRGEGAAGLRSLSLLDEVG